MPLKYFGVFLAYGPTVDLRKEGLGRLLGAVLKAAATKEDIRLVIACPEWLRANLLAFCEGEGIPITAFDLLTTGGWPVVARLYLHLLARRNRQPSKSRLTRLSEALQRFAIEERKRVERRFVAARTIIPWLAVVLYGLILALFLVPLGLTAWFASATLRLIRKAADRLFRYLIDSVARTSPIIHDPGEEGLEVRLYRLMEDIETRRLVKRIDTLSHVKGWFSPTSFWPEFNKIKAPTLLCVPDVLLTEFPIGFAQDGEMLVNFQSVEKSIRGARAFVTYSARVKWSTLVERYAVSPQKITVVRHACWDLSPSIAITGFADNQKATKAYCELLFQQALIRTGQNSYVQRLNSSSLQFLFYPSQFRPNKNVLLLIDAYGRLLRERFLHHKLILTGDPNRYPAVQESVHARGLTKDVIFLHGLTTAELAACYHLSNLAVNPSLSEGGCPFTFSEALSVNTPVVMARIPVTEEIFEDCNLREMMLFDPYDSKDMSSRIEWALTNREMLLTAQQEAYARLRKRTWRDVLDEYIVALDSLEPERIIQDNPK